MAEVSINTATNPVSSAIATNLITRDGQSEHIQLLNIADPSSAVCAPVGANGLGVYQPLLVGTYSYLAGSQGTVVVPAGQRVISFTAHASQSGSLTINGGPSFPIVAGTAISITPQGNLVGPTFQFNNTDQYYIETLQ